ncbi:MAG: flagellar biosynthesis protein FlgL [Rhodoferax sp.]|nr:flagellar biosynthesis protein FlgL [Rhodoferax sp.]
MRIATTQFHLTMSSALQTSQARLEHVMEQMNSGKRFLLPSDDPIANVRLSRMTREEAALDQYLDNIATLSTRLTQNETALDSTVLDMQQARELMVWASDGTNSSGDVNAMAGSLASLRDSLFFSANSKDQEGRYLFSGTATATPAISFNAAGAPGARYTFTGNTGTQQVAVGNGITQAANVSLPEMQAMLNWLDTTVTTLQAPGVDVNNPATRAVLTTTLDGLDTTLASVSSQIAALGGAQNILATLESSHGNVSVSNKQAMITLGQLDYGDAATQLAGYTTALEATQKAYGRISGLSLFDVL